ncbi:MAG: response regulator transcription factor [Chloroflexi bacterium]|nr:response regulator transcription factor [Chloroflexota bacterium]
MALVVIVSPTEGRRRALAQNLRAGGFTTVPLADVGLLAPTPAETRPDAILMDLVKADVSEAKAALQEAQQYNLPVLALLAEGLLDDEECHLKASDFLLEPLRPQELLTRISRLLRQRQVDGGAENLVRAGDLVINPEQYTVTLGGRPVLLTYKEYELLRLLASNPGKAYTRESLLNHVWGYDYFGGTRTVDVHIRRLREKIEDAHHSFIETVWNVGYRFKGQSGEPD